MNKAGLITGLSTDDENSILKMKTQMAATPTEPQHNQVGAPAQLTELRAYFQLGVRQTPQSVHAEPEYEPSVLSLPGQRLSPHGPKRPVGRPWKVPHSPVPQYEPSDPFPMPPPPPAGSWECIATTPAQMATLSEALRGIDVGGLPKPVDAVPSSGSLPSVEKAIGSSDQLRLAEVLKRVASIWAVSRELVKQDHEREARKQAKLKEERRLEEERHENRRLKAVADREHAILREEARLRVYDMEVRASGRGKRARKKVNYDERAFDRELNDAITDRPTRHAAARHDYERHDYEGSHDLRTRTLVNYSEADRALDEKNRDGTTTRDVTPPVSTAQESPRTDDGLGTDDDSEDERDVNIDPATGRAEIVNAGHLPPVRLAPGGGAILVPSTGDMAVAVAMAMAMGHGHGMVAMPWHGHGHCHGHGCWHGHAMAMAWSWPCHGRGHGHGISRAMAMPIPWPWTWHCHGMSVAMA